MKPYLFWILALLYSLHVPAIQAEELSGRDVMLKVEAIDRSYSDRHIINTMIVKRGNEQLIRKMESYTKKYGKDRQDDRTYIRFLEPADAKDTQYLTWSWEDLSRGDDMWIYMPAESLTRRVSSGGRKGAFMRSDIANEDIQKRSIDAFNYKLLNSEKIDGVDCWVVEITPIPSIEDETNYSKRIFFVRQDIHLPAKIDYYDKRGRLLKFETYGRYKHIDGVWTATKLLFTTPDRGTTTIMDISEVLYNQGVDETLFQPQNLKR